MDDIALWQKIENLLKEETDIDDKLKKDAAVLIQNVFRYLDKDARDIMVHRSHIIAIDIEETLSTAISFMLEHDFSRYPVYKEEIDDIQGFIYLRDAMLCYMDPDKRDKSLKELKDVIRPVTFIPETRHINKLMKSMQQKHFHLVIVLDEYGQTAGLVTMEDIIEEIVGNILDEHQEEKKLIESLPDGSFMADGFVDLEEIEKLIQIRFDSEDYNSLNGFLVNQLEHIPTEEEKACVSFEGYIFRILQVDNNMIRRVKIEKSI